MYTGGGGGQWAFYTGRVPLLASVGGYAYWSDAYYLAGRLNFFHKIHNNPSDKRNPFANEKRGQIPIKAGNECSDTIYYYYWVNCELLRLFVQNALQHFYRNSPYLLLQDRHFFHI